MDRYTFKKHLFFLFCACWLSSWAGENLLPNPRFQSGLEGWRIHFPEPNEQNYARNHDWVSLARVDGQPMLAFTFPGPVAGSEGVKAVSALIPVDGGPETTFVFGAELFSEKPSVIIFLEGYQQDPSQQVKGNDHYPGYVRSYRATLHVKAKKGEWATVRREIQPFKRERYAPSHVLIKLYAYHPAGTVRFRRVFLQTIDPN